MRSLVISSLLALTVACSSSSASIEDPPADGTPPAASTGGAPAGPAAGGSATASGDRADFGNQAAGTVIGFDVPAGTIGLTFVVDRANAGDGEYVGVEELVDPSGAKLISGYKIVGDDMSRYQQGTNGSGQGVVRVPFSNAHAQDPIASGHWTVKLGGSRVTGSKTTKGTTTPLDGNMHGQVFFQTSSAGMVDLDLYVPAGLVVDGTTVDATTAEPALKTRIDATYEMFQRLYGLTRGAVRYHAIDGSVKSIVGYAEVDAANVLATAPQADHVSAQVVLTNRLSPDGEGEGEISGLSCLPGAVGVPGTKCSAVLVSLRASSVVWEDASTLVHELGHFAGLEHTSEFDGGFDELDDTPECVNQSKNELPNCADHNNLMFPSVNLHDDGAAIGVSGKQKSIFVSSAFAHR